MFHGRHIKTWGRQLSPSVAHVETRALPTWALPLPLGGIKNKLKLAGATSH